MAGSATRKKGRRAECGHGKRPQFPEPGESLDEHRGEYHDPSRGEEPEANGCGGGRPGRGCWGNGWQIRNETRKLMTMATAQHGVDALPRFFEA